MTDRPTRRGFLAACSAAAAALGLTARVAPARPPIPANPDGESFDGPAHKHYLGPDQFSTHAYKAGEILFVGDACYIGADGRLYRSIVSRSGSGYTEVPFVVALHGGSPGATAKAWVATS